MFGRFVKSMICGHHVLVLCVAGLAGFCLSETPPPNVTPQEIGAALPSAKDLKHPYLYFTEKDKPGIRERIRNSETCNRIYAGMKEKADSYLRSRPRRPDMMALAFVYQMTGDRQYAQRAFELISRKKPSDASFDLRTSRSCRALAPLYDWLYEGLDDEQRAALRSDLLMELSKVRGKYPETWWVHATRCNWNPVCHSGAGVAAIALLADDPTLVDVLAEAYNGIYKTYNEISRDGGWCEGVNYWSYGLFTSLLYADALDRLTNGKFNLLGHERVQANPVSFGLYTLVPSGPFMNNPRNEDWKSVNFEDSGDHREDSAYGYSRLAAATGSGEAVWLKQTIYGDDGEEGGPFDILWYYQDVEPTLPEVASRHFRDYGWVVMRSDFVSADKVMLAAVSAEFHDPTREMYISRFEGAPLIPVSEKPWGVEVDTYFMSHGHLHAGTFNVYWQGEAYIAEMGKVGYPKDYWTTRRWDYEFANSRGHNTVFVNGEKQISGKGIGGEVVEFRTGADRDYTLMDVTKAYPGQFLKKWLRHLVLDKPDVTLVVDEIGAAPGDRCDVRLHSACDIEMNDGFLLLRGSAGLMALIPLGPEGWSFQSGTHVMPNDPALHIEENLTRYVDVHWTAAQVESRLAMLILPVVDAAEAQSVASSLRWTGRTEDSFGVSFRKGTDAAVYEFTGKNGDFRLKP